MILRTCYSLIVVLQKSKTRMRILEIPNPYYPPGEKVAVVAGFARVTDRAAPCGDVVQHRAEIKNEL